MDVHKLASLLVRDLTISAKTHHDLARSYTAMARTWRQVLDDSVPDVLTNLPNREDGKVGAPIDPFRSPLFEDHD